MISNWIQFSTTKFTAAVEIEDGRIKTAAPILFKFKGQPLDNLRHWLNQFDGFEEREINIDH